MAPRTPFFRKPFAALTVAAALAAPLPALAIGSITDGDVTFAYTQSFASSLGNTVNVDFTGAGPADMAYESWWFYRVSGGPREVAFGNPDAELYTGSLATLDWADPTGTGSFGATLRLEVIDSGVGMGNVFQSLTIVNTGLSALTLDVFHYSDFDLGGSAGNDLASLVANTYGIQIDVSDATQTAPMIGYGADAFQVDRYAQLLRDLTDGNVDDLDGSGLPFGPNDFTAAFQWSSVTLGAGESRMFLTQFGSNAPLLDRSVSVIPEPGTAILMALGLMLLATPPQTRPA
ncbi:MAG: hypothetical protein R3E53_23015 [Myxococcota bacterium]